MFGALWLSMASGATMTQFARGLGTPDYAFGILAAMPYLATLLQLPASYCLDRFGRRKALFIATQGPSRLLWIAVAVIPWIWPGSVTNSWPAMLCVLAVGWALFHLGVPAWMNWMSDVVPRRIRGRFYGNRQTIARPIAVVATLAVGAALDIIQRGHGTGAGGNGLMLKATSTLLMVAGLFGFLEILIYRRVHEPSRPSANHIDWLRNLLTPLRLANFRWFVALNMCMALGSGFMAQYIWLYMFDVGGYTNLQGNLLCIALPGIANLLVFPLWGRLVDRVGRKPVLVIAACGMLLNPFGWVLLASGAYPLWGCAVVMIGFVSWPGLEVATMNTMLDLAGSRSEQASGTAMVALNNIAIACAGTLSGFAGAVCASSLGHLDGSIPGLDIPLTYHAVLFMSATIFRAMAVICASCMHDVNAAPSSDVIRYMTSTLYGNVRQAILMPTRVVGQISARAYRVGTPRSKQPRSK